MAVGHNRAVSYARFHGRSELVTASVDGSIRRWRLDVQPSTGCSMLAPLTEFRGHQNTKNFVGLSVHRAARQHGSVGSVLVACGSEDGVTHVFGSGKPAAPLATWRLDAVGRAGGEMAREAASVGQQEEFISSVCWQPDEAASPGASAPLLAVASSDGDLRLLKLH